jgi:glycosyltransferase involved in cell wall biosynthesis
LLDYFEFVGNLDFERVLQYYKSCDLLVFPSFLESFGLPLVEAAKFGKKILAADLDYAREVLAGYDGVIYLPIHNPDAWGDAIYKCSEKQEKFNSWEPKFAKNSWGKFFELVENFIRE